jgi:hypothetical protein
MKSDKHKTSHRPGSADYRQNDLVDFESRAYRRFSRRIDRQLAKLVNRWAHLAAPNALRNAASRTSQLGS